jgi:DNA-binding transcriptional MocR family regulator
MIGGDRAMPVNSFLNYHMSWKPEKHQLKRPIYLSLAEKLEQDIKSGLLAPGTKLPPQRELADFLDINFTTVTRAYSLCERKGLIYAVTGSGTFVSPNAKLPITISLDNTPKNLIELGFIASFEQCNSMVVETVQEVSRKKYVEQLFGYDDPTGMQHQKMAGINWMKPFGIEAGPENMAIVSGALNALAITLYALFEPGDKIAVDTFTYSNFIELARTFQIQLIAISGDEEGMLPAELYNQCVLSGIDGVFLMPSCSNPATVMISQQRKKELAKVIREQNLILIEDDVYAFLSAGLIKDYEGPMYQFIPDQTIYICGTSKSICSGLRIAYMVFGEQFREKILKGIFNINVKTSSFDAEIITELILNGTAHQIVNEKKRLAECANKLYQDCFSSHALNEHPYSYHRWLPISTKLSSEHLEASLKERGIQVFHSDRFLCNTSEKKTFLRVALSSCSTLEELEKGLHILKNALEFL